MIVQGQHGQVSVDRERVARQASVGPAPGLLAQEVAHLSRNQFLLKSNEYSVYWAKAREIPLLLFEIGRLREETFRLVGEGTGEPVDLDAHDTHYLHLFVWRSDQSELVGAYRLGQTDMLLPAFGPNGLYTASLFQYAPQLLARLTPGLELGRSFIRRKYQRLPAPLYLLWRGIGEFLVRFPRYRVLFGAVSISRDYHEASRSLIVSFLRLNSYRADLARFVRAQRDPLSDLETRSLGCEPAEDIDALCARIESIEDQQRSVPILLKQYLRLGARVLSFNEDPKFSDVLDALMMLDLTTADARLLRRYMGMEGMASYFG